MAIGHTLKMTPGNPPVRDDGAPVIVLLDREKIAARGIEYYGHPVVLVRWETYAYATLDCQRISYDEIIAWLDIAPPESPEPV